MEISQDEDMAGEDALLEKQIRREYRQYRDEMVGTLSLFLNSNF